jgi:hypothetical protein
MDSTSKSKSLGLSSLAKAVGSLELTLSDIKKEITELSTELALLEKNFTDHEKKLDGIVNN